MSTLVTALAAPLQAGNRPKFEVRRTNQRALEERSDYHWRRPWDLDEMRIYRTLLLGVRTIETVKS